MQPQTGKKNPDIIIVVVICVNLHEKVTWLSQNDIPIFDSKLSMPNLLELLDGG